MLSVGGPPCTAVTEPVVATGDAEDVLLIVSRNCVVPPTRTQDHGMLMPETPHLQNAVWTVEPYVDLTQTHVDPDARLSKVRTVPAHIDGSVHLSVWRRHLRRVRVDARRIAVCLPIHALLMGDCVRIVREGCASSRVWTSTDARDVLQSAARPSWCVIRIVVRATHVQLSADEQVVEPCKAENIGLQQPVGTCR